MERTTNIPTLSVGEFIRKALNMYVGFNKMNLLPPPIMLWGAPGVGKSQAIVQLAEKLGEILGKKVHTTDVRLVLFNPVDLRGIPTADVNKEFCKWLKPQIFQMDESDDVINVLILEELTAAPPSVQAAAYQITLDRQIGEHKLPNNCIILAAGNRITDKSVAYSMPKALCNRLTHFVINVNVDSWLRWALENKIDTRIVAFIKAHRTALYTSDEDLSKVEEAYPTPRSWEMVDKYIKVANGDINMVENFIEGTVGKAMSTEFTTFCRLFTQVPDMEEIADGTYTEHPKEMDINFIIQTSLVNYIYEHKELYTNKATKIDEERLGNILNYIEGMDVEYRTLTFKELVNNSDFLLKVVQTEQFLKFSKELQKYLHD